MCFNYSLAQSLCTFPKDYTVLEIETSKTDSRIQKANTPHLVVYNKTKTGEIKPESKTYVLSILNDLIYHGAQGVVLGCTDIFDKTAIHSLFGVDYILNK
ncbi:hypothetical protein [Formosa sp. PL04]|uniref:hypothetical protein n=1 Tax=Formosa sp. PL04 TaxID=3081755 RepID=UPI00298111DF|nr:hypothetical protein [Formosa sp. PL04]MDW5290850.1 hypothetical protein [Formosa sp. PL04]